MKANQSLRTNPGLVPPEPLTLWVAKDGPSDRIVVNRVCIGRPGDGRVVYKWGVHRLSDARWVEFELESDADLTAGMPLEHFLATHKAA